MIHQPSPRLGGKNASLHQPGEPGHALIPTGKMNGYLDYGRLAMDFLVGFLAKIGNRGVIFAPANEIRCGAIRKSPNFNNL